MDKYTKVKKIGEGSFGTAILVKHNESGEHFVVKEIGISKMKPKERNEARKEVLVLSKMRHPNIVQYTESFEENGHLYIIMEYCEGGDLYALINKQRGVAFPERQVLSWFVQICLALKHVHDRKILHRDIKTSNIFLTKSGTIKLGDFGIARVLNNTMELARTCIGTPYYLSPEICENKPYNNKSDVWALGCVVYETLTLKHAFEAGNMKNLVLKIIRGSYPPVPSRYSYELRSLVSQLFRRNPRERPSINSILRKPFISPLTAEHLSQEQHEAEFSHTVLHKGRKPAPRPSPANPSRYQPQPAAKRARNLEIYGAQVGVRNRRDQQIAAAYGPSVAAKPKPKPSRLANAHNAVDNILEKKRQQLLEQERIRKENLIGEKKRRLEEMQKRQRDRAIKMKEDQLRRARDEARMLNLKRSADMLNDEEEKVTKPPRPSGRDRPVSAPRERGDYEKYNDFLDQMEQKERPVANPFPQPGLDKVKAAWEERQKEQDARFAQINRAAADKAAQRAEIVQEYLQRKEEARMNKRKGNDQGFRKPRPVVGVAAALRPYSAAPAKAQASEQEYLAKLQKIRAQNYNDRKQIVNKGVGPYKVDVASDVASEEQRKKKISALQKQAQDRAQLLKKNMEDRRAALDAREEEKKRKQEGMAKPREIVHPDQRPVKYNPTPIGITQALRAVGAPILSEDPVIPPNPVASPSKPIIDERKRILQRVNQRYSMDFDADAESAESRLADSAKKDEVESMKLETEKTQVEKENSAAPRPLPQLPLQNKTKVLKPTPKGWGPSGDIGLKIAELPLQETASHMEATHVIDDVTKRSEPAKKGWAVPSGTFVRRLNQLTIHQPTMTMPPDENDELLETIEPSTSPTPTKPSMEDNSVEQKSPETETELTPVNSKTTVIRKSPESETPTQPTVKIAPNFKLSQLGTYVIPKTPETGSLDLVEKPETSEIKPTDVTSKPELVSKVSKPPSGLDDVINDDIEEVKLVDETKTTNDEKNQQTKAWSQQNQPDGQLVPAKPELKPKPRLLPKPSVSEDRTPTNVVKTPEKPSRDNTPKSSPELSDSDTLKKENQKPSTPPKSLAPVSCESPLFVKRPLPSKVTTSPAFKLPDEDMETPKVDPLSKSLYTTASDRVLLKLTMGQFDSPNPKLLRTCSLPDLASCSDAQSDDAEDPPDTGDAVRMSVASSMNDTNFDEDEEVSLPDSDAVATDDEEMNNLRANLENVLLEAEDAESSPSFSAHQTVDIVLPDNADDDDCDVDDDASDDVSENGDWDSGSNASSAGEVSDTESVYSRLEHSREALERELGLKAFLEAYRYVQAIHEDEDEGVAECEARVRDVLGAKHDAIYPRILQLVMADGAYCEDNS